MKSKPWYVGLLCRKCGQLVKQGGSGYFSFPLGAQPWAECGPCREEPQIDEVYEAALGGDEDAQREVERR